MTKTAERALIDHAIREDCGVWFESGCAKIWDKDRKLISPTQNHLQRLIRRVLGRMEELGLPLRVIGLKPRQKGSTTYFGAEDYHWMRRHAASVCVIGGQYSQTNSLWSILQTYNDNDSFNWGNSGKIHDSFGEWTNGSRLTSETAGDKLAGISSTFQVLHATEVARWSSYGVANAPTVLANILKCVPLIPNSVVFLESSAEGACFDDTTEILTDKGWRLFKDLAGDEGILTKDPETNVAYYQKEWEPVVHKYKGPMVLADTRTCNFLVTPNHKIWTTNWKKKWVFREAGELAMHTGGHSIDRAFKWKKPGLTHVTIPHYTHIQGNGYRTLPNVDVPIDIWLRFLGHWLTDGHVTYMCGRKVVVLTQVKYTEEFRESITAISRFFGRPLKENAHGNGRRFNFYSAQLANYLLAYSKPKRIPRELLMGLSSSQCKDLIDSCYLGDGGNYNRDAYKIDRGMIYAGLDKEFQDDLQELSLKAGYASSVHGQVRNRRTTYTSSIKAHIRHSNPLKIIPEYEGIVYCVTLPQHHLLMVRRKGIAHWSGNSGSFHERWIEATDAEDFLSGAKEIMPGDYVRVFSPWFEFGDSTMRLTEPQKEVIRSTLDSDPDFDGEKMLLSRYGRIDESGVQRLGESVTEHDAWEQLAWRRYAIAKECGKDRLIFDRDYPHSWQDAFMKSGNMRFSRSGLSILRDRMHERVPLYGTLQEAQGRPVFHQTDPLEAKVILFERPMPMRRYILSVDPMTGAMQASGKDPDFHGVFVMQGGFQDGTGKWNPPAAVARVVPCRWDIDVLEETIWRLARHYGDSSGCKIVVEMNQDRGLTELLKQRGADLYMREVFNQTEFKTTKAYGYLTMEKSRERAIECLAAAIRDWDEPGGGVRLWDEHAIRQLENFIRKANGRSEAADGHHDDDVFSLALGLLLIEHATIFNPNAGMSYIPPDLLPIIGGAQGLPGQFS